LDYQFIYSDSVPFTPTNHLSSVVQITSPGLEMKIGDHWTLGYGAALHLYSDHQFADDTDQNVMLSGNTTYQDWHFGLSQAYSYSDTPLTETEAQTSQTTYSTLLSAGREMGSRLSTQSSLSQSISSSKGITGSTTNNSQDLYGWVASSGLYYQTDYRLVAGINASGGYNAINPGSDMEFEQLQGTVSWQPLAKFSLVGSVGGEFSQLGGQTLADPTFSAAINYQPFERTSLSLIASRTVTPSLYQSEVVEATQVSATFRQRFFEHYNFEVSAGYATSPFVGFVTPNGFLYGQYAGGTTAAIIEQNRTDFSRSVRVSLGTSFRQHGSASVFYSFQDTSSTLSPFALTSSQVGFEIGWHY
jgi:hypothetical protein